MTGANWMYVNSHFVITTTFLIWLYLARNDAYYFVRNMFMVAMGLALVGYVAYPTAPPRFMPEWGFTDTVATFVGDSPSSTARTCSTTRTPRSPSMHVAFALMIAVPAICSCATGCCKRAVGVLPGVVTFVVVVTANHFWIDAALGALVAASPRWPPREAFARARPEAWAWRSREAKVPRDRRGRSARSAPPRAPRGPQRQRGEMRAAARDRLIESRLTPNAISLTGFVLNLVAAVLITQQHFVLAGFAFIVGSLMDMFDGRYSRMSGKGTPVRRVPRLHARPHRGGRGPRRRRGLLRRAGRGAGGGLTVLAVVGSYMVSYTRARAEALGVECKVGIASRAVRVVLPALFQRQGSRVISVPVSHRERMRGTSKYGMLNRLWVGIVDICGVMWLRRRYKSGLLVRED